ncbi:MAG TPA: LON peptidase substrate-binding domain-containing protein [Euzebyales bacterium]|nr:LON peptidase substrate-binding domain-containing protein [Euzebyales bacterium]
MSYELPLFPLHVVLFPGRPLPLHVFEPRYRRLLSDCLAGDRRFGVVAIRYGRAEHGSADVYGVGTVAEIVRVERLDDGRANIVTRGSERFRIERLLRNGPYLRARVTQLDEQSADPSLAPFTATLRAHLQAYLCAMGASDRIAGRLPASPSQLAWLAACTAELHISEQQQLLEIDSLAERMRTTIRLLRREHHLLRRLGHIAVLRPQGPAGATLN